MVKNVVMKFTYKSDSPDGLVLIDKAYLEELNDKLLYELDILLDRNGKSELVYDFPNENWGIVWKRETKEITKFCNSGKMVIFLHSKNEVNCEISFADFQNDSNVFIYIKSGKLIVVNASELIQCLSYPDLEMETLWEIDNLNIGMYSINCKGINFIEIQKSNTQNTVNNIITFY